MGTRRLLAALTVGVGLVLLATTPAGAETTIDVTTPADGRALAGHPTPLIVTIDADQALTGTLTATFEGFLAGSQEVEVAGGSTKEVVFIVNTPPWLPNGSVTFTPDNGDDPTTTRLALNSNSNDELVAVLGDLTDRNLPATAELAIDIGMARFYPVEPSLLSAGPDALSPFSQFLTTANDLAGLDPTQLDAVRSWLAGSGGTLVLDDDTGTPLPTGFGEGEGGLGAGSISFVEGDAGAGRYDGLLRPTPSRSSDQFPWGGFGGAPTTPALARDAGVSVPPIGSLVVVLLVYLVVAGPVLWIILRRSRREPLVWLALPAVALLTTGGVYLLGRSIRDNASTAHATLVADLPHLRSVSTQVLVTSPNGGAEGIRLTEGWRPASQSPDEMFFFDGPFGGPFGGGPMGAATPILRGEDLVADLPPGGVGVVAAELTTPGVAADPSWHIDLADGEDGSLVGTVTNLTAHDLEEVMVASGQGFQRVTEIAAGESAEVTLRNTNVPPLGNNRLLERLWSTDPWSPNDSAVNPGVLLDWLGRQPALQTPGHVMVVGWTKDAPAPVSTLRGFEVTAGRTAFLSAARLDDDLTGGEPYRLELLRGWNSDRLLDQVGGNVCADSPLTVRLASAHDIDPTRAVLDLSRRSVAGMDVWNGDEWLPAGIQDAAEDRVITAVPRGALDDGELYLRVMLGCEFWNMANPFPDLRPSTSDDVFHQIPTLDSAGDDDA